MNVSGIRETRASLLQPAYQQTSPARKNSAADTRIDKVSLSPAALTQSVAPPPARLQSLATSARADADLAETLAYRYAHTQMDVGIDATAFMAGTGPLRYAATGETVTPEGTERFNEQSASLQKASAALYETERAKGTAAADILDKLFGLIGTQSPDFLKAIQWTQ